MTDFKRQPKRTARCVCGNLTVVARSDPSDVYACSCRACQRRSGSAFTYSALYPEAAITVSGEHRRWLRYGASGRPIETAFCPTCGAAVFFRTEGWPGMVGVAVGCFADQDSPRPSRLYWASRRHRWLGFPATTGQVETQPGRAREQP